MPRYDFMLGQRIAGSTVRISRDHIVIAEGIHALNPHLLPDVPPNGSIASTCRR